jgi:hypothetical protein
MEIRLRLTGHRVTEPQLCSLSFHLLVRLLKYLPIFRFVSVLPSIHIPVHFILAIQPGFQTCICFRLLDLLLLLVLHYQLNTYKDSVTSWTDEGPFAGQQSTDNGNVQYNLPRAVFERNVLRIQRVT